MRANRMRSPYEVPSIGGCVYCKSLLKDKIHTDEHIVPVGLGGKRYIVNGSCGDCQEVTKKFENAALRTFIRPARLYMNLSKRHKKSRPSTFIVHTRSRVHMDKDAVLPVRVPIERLPIELALPVYPLPGILTASAPAAVHSTFSMMIDQSLQTHHNKLRKELADQHGDVILDEPIVPHDAWMRMLAKIAHCAMVARPLMRSNISILPELIFRLQNANLSGYIGGSLANNRKEKYSEPHQIRFGHYYDTGGPPYFFAEITLFANYKTPSYLVLCGIDMSGSNNAYGSTKVNGGDGKPKPFAYEDMVWTDGFSFGRLPNKPLPEEFPDFQEVP